MPPCKAAAPSFSAVVLVFFVLFDTYITVANIMSFVKVMLIG
jgi:hypothetical protein